MSAELNYLEQNFSCEFLVSQQAQPKYIPDDFRIHAEVNTGLARDILLLKRGD
jgi:hypothetical protein